MKKCILAFICLAAIATAGPVISFPNFSSIAGLTLNGTASQNGSALQLTPNTTSQAGSAWFSSAVDISGGFDTTFIYTLANSGGIGAADGIAFVLQTVGTSALGSAGGGIGAQGIANGVAVALRTFSHNDVEVDSCAGAISIGGCIVGGNTSSQTVFGTNTVEVIYLPSGTLNVKFDGTQVLSDSINLVTAIGSPSVFAGFTGGTGSGFETQSIDSWTLTATPEPATFGAVGAFGLMLIGFARRRK